MKTKSLVAVVVALLLSISLCLSVAATGLSDSKASVELTGGAIEFLEAPSFDFGEQAVKGRDANYPAESVTGQVTIKDYRGTGEGWKVKVQLSEFVDGGGQSLTGSKLNLSTKPVVSDGSMAAPPSYTHDGSGVIAGATEGKILWRAEPGEGNGSWKVDLTPRDVSLYIPGVSAKVGTFNADLTWTLENTP